MRASDADERLRLWRLAVSRLELDIAACRDAAQAIEDDFRLGTSQEELAGRFADLSAQALAAWREFGAGVEASLAGHREFVTESSHAVQRTNAAFRERADALRVRFRELMFDVGKHVRLDRPERKRDA